MGIHQKVHGKMVRHMMTLLFAIGFSIGLVFTARDDDPFIRPYMPITVPLAVRSPYLGAYLSGRTGKNLAHMSPNFWSTSALGWTGLIRVDGLTYNWMGNLTSWPEATNSSFSFNSYSSTFEFTAGGTIAHPAVQLTARFVSPITPTDLERQSVPFSYLELTVASFDGIPHAVELYTDVNGLWLADEEDEILVWAAERTPTVSSARVRLANQRPYEERFDRILNGDLWYASSRRPGPGGEPTISFGRSANVTRAGFAASGVLRNQLDLPTSRPIRTRDKHGNILDEPVFAFAHNFGTVSPDMPLSEKRVLMAIGHVRNPVVRYMTEGEIVRELNPLWARRFKDSPRDMLVEFMADHTEQVQMSESWDQQLMCDGTRLDSVDYARVLALSTRQIFQAFEAVWDKEAGDTEPLMMLKEISSNGNCQTLDVIMPLLPFLIYAAPELIPAVLEPVYRYLSTGLYTPLPAPHDLGDHYPNVTGRNGAEYATLPIEESGNAIAIAYAGVRLGVPRAIEQARSYWGLIQQWATWLEENTLFPYSQRSTDDFFGPSANQTGLVIKGLVALAAMSDMALALEKKDEHLHYKEVSASLTAQFLEIGVSEDKSHLLGIYGNQASWVTHYNLYLDKLLGTKVFPEWVYEMQDAFYPTKAERYGPALDWRFPERAKTDWLLWTAGASDKKETRRIFVDAVVDYFHQSRNAIFGDSITPQEGWSVGFLTRPVVGGHFSLLALDKINRHTHVLAWFGSGSASILHRLFTILGDTLTGIFGIALTLVVTLVAILLCQRLRRRVRAVRPSRRFSHRMSYGGIERFNEEEIGLEEKDRLLSPLDQASVYEAYPPESATDLPKYEKSQRT